MANRRTTLRDIAQVCGCSTMAVSLALRNDASVSKKRRAEICEVAKKLNYLPDPALSALAAYRRTRYPQPTATPIAWVSNYPTFTHWNRPDSFVKEYFDGATQRAKEFGYHLEHFWLRESGMTAQRLSNVLYTRGISGILLPPQPTFAAHLNLDWDKFCAVTFGYSLARPRLHMTTTNHYHSMGMVVRKLRSLGYRRIGLAIDILQDTRVMRNYYASYLIELLRIPKKNQIPAVFLPVGFKEAMSITLKWFRLHRPEVIICSNGSGFTELLRGEGMRIPEDVGLVSLGTSDRKSGESGEILSGADQNFQAVGGAAVDLLLTLMHRNERGVPSTPRNVLIDSKWIPGTTVRRVKQTSSVQE